MLCLILWRADALARRVHCSNVLSESLFPQDPQASAVHEQSLTSRVPPSVVVGCCLLCS